MAFDPLRILVVDDNVDTADSIATYLRLRGDEVWTAHDAPSALALADLHRPHCVLVDVIMPAPDGVDLCRRLKAAHGDDIVLVVMTGGDEVDPRVVEAFAISDHHFQKPFDLERLSKLLHPPLHQRAGQ
ncbi:MAG: response regulator [Burkholderiales bacterium]